MNQMFYTGIVENRTGDPLKLGRVQVRVFGVHTEVLSDIPTADLPWAIPIMPATSASLSGIGNSVTGYVEGTLVFVFFQDGESKQQPVILGSAHGIPQSKTPFSGDTNEDVSPEPVSTSTATPSVVTSSDGTAVTDSSGTPVQTGISEPPIDGLDISRMVSAYGSNVTTVYQSLKDFGINDNYAIVAILSNIAKECKYKLVRESMKYSSISRLKQIFPSKFPALQTPAAETEAYSKYVNNEELLANLVYSNKMGNGNTNSGEGYKYRGGGYIQLTGKNNYTDVGKSIGINLVSNPELIIGSAAAKAAAQYFINRFGGAKRLSFSSLEEALQSVTRKVNPGGYSNDYPKVVTASKLCTITVSAEKAAEKEAEKEAASPNDPANDVDTSATSEQINSGTTSKTENQTAIGFKDPASRYPLLSYLKEPDTNRLARSSYTATSVESKRKNRRSSIKSIGGEFSEPDSAFNGQYPYNHVYATESGHIQEFDDTPGSERIHTYHKSGTFTEIDSFGNQVNKIVGDSFSITERNGYIYIDGTARITVGSDVKLLVGGNLDIEVDGNLNYNVGGDVIYKVGGSMKIGTGSSLSAQTGSSIDMDSSVINLNSGTSEAITPEARSGAASNDYPRQIPESAISSASIVIEDVDSAVASAHIEKEIAAGNITKKEIDDGAAAKPETVDETPPVNKTPLAASCAIFEGKTDIADSTQISKNFTIAMVSSRAPAGAHKLRAQHGLTVSQIACNLKKVAENCLDAIKAQYPNMFVTSGFRVGNGTSQHERGQAIDMQFRGVSNSGFFEIATWIKNNVLFDQLLLEYKTIESGNAWIHISYTDSPRKVVYTYMNHKNAGTGLRKLQ